MGLVGAAIYLAGIIEGEHRTQRLIATTSHVTKVTFCNRYKVLVRQLNLNYQIKGV